MTYNGPDQAQQNILSLLHTNLAYLSDSADVQFSPKYLIFRWNITFLMNLALLHELVRRVEIVALPVTIICAIFFDNNHLSQYRYLIDNIFVICFSGPSNRM